MRVIETKNGTIYQIADDAVGLPIEEHLQGAAVPSSLKDALVYDALCGRKVIALPSRSD